MSIIALDISAELIKEMTAATKKVVEYNKLGDSSLNDSIEWIFKDDVFFLVANDYMKYVERGKKPRARKVPIEPLIKWIKKKQIKPRDGQTINSLAYAIQNGIYKSGIKAKQMFDPIINYSLDVLSEYISESLSISVAEEIAKDMTMTLPTNS